MRRAALLFLLGLSSAACFPPSVLSPDARERVARATARQPRYLRVAVYAGPFFGDSSKVLLSDRPAVEISAMEAPDGKPLPVPPPDRILAPGTALFVDSVQFPTGSALWLRPVSTPRFLPWLVGQAEGDDRTAVILLSAQPANAEDVLAEVGRVLTPDDPAPAFRALPEGQRSAIQRKELVEGMSQEATAMAWGYPDRIVLDSQARTEEWSWASGRRHALFQDERLVRFEVNRADATKARD